MKFILYLFSYVVILYCITPLQLNAQDIVKTNEKINQNKFSQGGELMAYSFGYDFLQRKKWAIGVEATVGFGLRINLSDNKVLFCDQGCAETSLKFTHENFKFIAYFKYYYFRNNSINIGINYSYFIGDIIEWSDFPMRNHALGADITIYYGWEKIKLGTGFQPNVVSVDWGNGNKGKTFIFLWTPLKIRYLF